MDTCEADMALDINHFWQQHDAADFVNDDPDDQEDVITTTTTTEEEEQQGGDGDMKDDEAVEVFDIQDAKDEEAVDVFDIQDAESLPVGGGDEDFDFTKVTAEPTVAPAKDEVDQSGPPPSHNEPPERQPVPHVDSSPPSQTPAAATFSATLSDSSTSSSSSNVAMYAVAAVAVSLIVAFVLRKTRRRRQQAMFQDAWREAEKEIVNSHRNLNYRDHSSVQTKPIGFSPDRDGSGGDRFFQDEEDPNKEMDFDDEEERHRSTFVLDTVMLDKMN
jgi:hypothetical protein